MTMSFKTNHLCALAARCGKSVALLWFKQREHVGPVRVWGSPITEMLVWEDGRGFYGPSGIHVSILAGLHPLCLGHIIHVNSQSRDAGNKIFCFNEFAVWVGLWALYLVFVVVAGEVPAGWMPAFCLTANFVQSSIQAAACSYGNNSSTTESWRMFNISKRTLSRSLILLCYVTAFQPLNTRGQKISCMLYLIRACLSTGFITEDDDDCDNKACCQYQTKLNSNVMTLLIPLFEFQALRVHINALKIISGPFKKWHVYWQNMQCILFLQCQHVSPSDTNQNMSNRPWNSRQIADSAADCARARHALSCC